MRRRILLSLTILLIVVVGGTFLADQLGISWCQVSSALGAPLKYCEPGSSDYCTSGCCTDITEYEYVSSCTKLPNYSYCRQNISTGVKECDGACATSWDVGSCSSVADGCQRLPWVVPGGCCSDADDGGGGGGGDDNDPPPCEPVYEAPRIDMTSKTQTPPYPLVLGQDPDLMGITIAGIAAYAGEDTTCDGPAATITSFTSSISLSSASVDWIEGYLASRYYGAHVLGSYPMSPDDPTMSGIGTPFATLGFHFENPDPGNYEVKITATQSDDQIAELIFLVESYLLDVTLTSP